MKLAAVAVIASYVFVWGCGGGVPAEPLVPDTHDPATTVARATPPTPPAPAGPDLSTAEKAKAEIYAAAKAGDKEAFKRCVSKRNLAKHENGFDGWFEIWKTAAQRGPDAFKKIVVVEEDGAWKLDEN